MKKAKRIAIFVESHEGYGHFNIVSQLARKLQDEGAEVMLLSGTLNYAGAAQTFNFKDARLVHLPLVDYRILPGGKWEYTTTEGALYEESPHYIASRKRQVAEAIADFKPDAVITEFFPFQQSFRRHDMDAVASLYEGKARPETIALCRDIIHSGKPAEVLSLLDRHYDRILVRGDEKFSSLAQSQKEWRDITLPVEYMGNFITSMPKRDTHMKEKDRHVVVFGGGGYYDKDLPFFKSIIAARAHSQRFSDHIWDIYLSENTKKHMMDDPAHPGTQVSALDYIMRLANEAGHGNIRVFEPIDSKKFREELANAALAITRGGYNTTFELYAAGTPQLVVPRLTQEQVQRANALYVNGMAQIYPRYPIEEKRDIEKAMHKTKTLARAVDTCPDIEASAPKLNNHGAQTTAEHLLGILRKKEPKPLHVALFFEDAKHKRHDAARLAEELERAGHHVHSFNSSKVKVMESRSGAKLHYKGELIDCSRFDVATLRSPVEVPQTKGISQALAQAGVPVYQDYPMLEVAGDKWRSHKHFEAHGVPTPDTFGYAHNEWPQEAKLSAFLDRLGAGPYVVKASRGWSGKQVQIVDSREEALAAFRQVHAEARKAHEGGAILQRYIESAPGRCHDYRIQTVLSYTPEGEEKLDIVAAAKRVAQPGIRITNVSKGAEKKRVALNDEEARRHCMEKGKTSINDYEAQVRDGQVEILSPTVKDAAEKAARAFGSGSLGVDVMVDHATGQASVLEVNPFAGGNRNFEEVHGFSLYAPWAEAIVAHGRAHKQGKLPVKETHMAQTLMVQPHRGF